jgi:hypothetical protein
MRPADTSPEAWKVFLELQRRMTPAEKIRLAFEWSEGIRRLAEASARKADPAAGDRAIFLRVARLTLGDEIFVKAYGGEAGTAR